MKKSFSILFLITLLCQPIPAQSGVDANSIIKELERDVIVAAAAIAIISPIVVFGSYKLLRLGYDWYQLKK